MSQNIQDFPSALGTGLCLQSESKRLGHYSERVDEEWLDGAQLPASNYSQPMGGHANFVPGCGQYFVPSNHKQRKKGECKSFCPSSTTSVLQVYEQTFELITMKSDIICCKGEGQAKRMKTTCQSVFEQSPEQMQAASLTNPGFSFIIERK